MTPFDWILTGVGITLFVMVVLYVGGYAFGRGWFRAKYDYNERVRDNEDQWIEKDETHEQH